MRVTGSQRKALTVFLVLVSGASGQSFLRNDAYVKECESKGALVPQQIDCSKGQEIEVFQSTCDASGAVLKKEKLTRENFRRLGKKCDHPALVQKGNSVAGCVPGSTIQWIENQNQSVCAVVCRRTDNDTERGLFNDVSMICHNPDNGATCFFNSKVEQTHQPLLSRPGSAGDRSWMQPNELERATCIHCHDKNPFLVTPNLGGFGEKIKAQEHIYPYGKYFVVGSGKPFTDSVWKNRYVIGETNGCTSCHRMGAGKFGGCGYLTQAATGSYARNAAEARTSCGFEKGFMPPEGHELKDFLADIERIRECCRDFDERGVLVSSPKCKWELLPGL